MDMYFLTQEYSCLCDDELVELIGCNLNLLENAHPDRNSLNYVHIWAFQHQNKKLLALHNKDPDNYAKLKLEDDIDDIICYKVDPTPEH